MDAVNSMEVPTGVKLFDLLAQYKNESLAPKSFKDLYKLEEAARENGFDLLADYIKSWRLFMEYHIRAEWKD